MHDYHDKRELLTRNPHWTDCTVLSFVAFVTFVMFTVIGGNYYH